MEINIEQKVERRYLQPTKEIQFRAFDEGGKRFLEGYSSLFEIESKLIFENGQKFHEIIERGAFDEILADPRLNTIYNFNHIPAKIIARTTSGTLILSVDEIGLKFRAEIPDISYANDLFTLVQRGDLYENSFAFTVNKDNTTLERNKQGDLIRRVKKVSHLFDVSTVINAAYSGTSIKSSRIWARGITEFIDNEEKEIETPKLNNDIEKYQRKIKILKLL